MVQSWRDYLFLKKRLENNMTILINTSQKKKDMIYDHINTFNSIYCLVQL